MEVILIQEKVIFQGKKSLEQCIKSLGKGPAANIEVLNSAFLN